MEQVDFFKYLGVILDEKLSFTKHVTPVQKKSQQRLHVLRMLRAFYVDPLLLLRLYRSIIEPLITYCSICYYPALSVKNMHAFAGCKRRPYRRQRNLVGQSKIHDLSFYSTPC